MTNNFFENIYNHPAIKYDNYKEIVESHSKVELAKNEIIQLEGKVSNEYYLIEKGLFRSFVIDYKGNEITTDFFGTDEILIEVASLFLRIPAKENLQSLTDSICNKIEFNNFQKLYSCIEGFTEWGRTWFYN